MTKPTLIVISQKINPENLQTSQSDLPVKTVVIDRQYLVYYNLVKSILSKVGITEKGQLEDLCRYYYEDKQTVLNDIELSLIFKLTTLRNSVKETPSHYIVLIDTDGIVGFFRDDDFEISVEDVLDFLISPYGLNLVRSIVNEAFEIIHVVDVHNEEVYTLAKTGKVRRRRISCRGKEFITKLLTSGEKPVKEAEEKLETKESEAKTEEQKENEGKNKENQDSEGQSQTNES